MVTASGIPFRLDCGLAGASVSLGRFPYWTEEAFAVIAVFRIRKGHCIPIGINNRHLQTTGWKRKLRSGLARSNQDVGFETVHHESILV
jgi:hypothetical protein